MFQRFQDHWPEIILALFAVGAGQIGRLGQKLERGEPIGWRQVIIELSMFPAFGAMAGALGMEMRWPIWVILGVGITAGWLGFFTFRLIARVMGFLARNLVTGLQGAIGPHLPDEAPPPPSPPLP